MPAAHAAEPAYRAVAEIGVQRIRERSLSMTQPLLEAALERGWTVRSPLDPAHRGGHVTIDPTPDDPAGSVRVHDALIERGVVVDHRPGVGIRVAPHFYNTWDECTLFLDTVTEVLAQG